MKRLLPPGKVPWELVAELVAGELPPQVRLGPGVGEDAALVEIGGETWAVASDPISFTSSEAGRLAVIVNANDVAVRGARPSLFLAVALIAPEEASPELVQKLLSQVRGTCAEVGATLIGGHTEVTPGLPHSIVVGTMLGRVEGRALTTAGLREGDFVGMTRWAGLEGTHILLGELGERLRELHGGVSFELPPEAREWLLVAPDALRAAACPGVTALHDVTEGGVGEALHEMAAASGLRIEARREDIPLLPVTAEVEAVMVAAGTPFQWIGRAVDSGRPGTIVLPHFPRDELLKASAMEGIEAVVFDLDGTLVDSAYDWPEIRRRLGVTGGSIIDALNGLSGEERAARWAALEAIEAAATEGAGLHPGVRELLGLLRERGLCAALVTNNNQANATRLLERFTLDFEVVLTRDSGLWKPSGAPVAEAARRLGVPPERCLAVGDSHYDILAAREAGAKICVVHDDEGQHDGETDLSFADIPFA
ncbi:MAG: HAD-IA family hydrolase [Acidobacteriota bacterium]